MRISTHHPLPELYSPHVDAQFENWILDDNEAKNVLPNTLASTWSAKVKLFDQLGATEAFQSMLPHKPDDKKHAVMRCIWHPIMRHALSLFLRCPYTRPHVSFDRLSQFHVFGCLGVRLSRSRSLALALTSFRVHSLHPPTCLTPSICHSSLPTSFSILWSHSCDLCQMAIFPSLRRASYGARTLSPPSEVKFGRG